MKNPKIISYKKFRDKRGYFSEIFKKNKLKNLFIQDNLVFNKKKNTFRGLHYQLKPFDQGKLITVLKGSIIDYVTKINKKSQKNEAIKKFFLSEKDSKEIDKEIYEDIKSFCNSLKGGDFDSMVDLYNYRDNVINEDGYYYSFHTKYIFTSNKPPFGSKEYEMSENKLNT